MPPPTLLRPHRWLLHLHDQLPAAAGGRDPRAVHQLRVAAARLRVWLELGGLRVLRDDLRFLRAAAGPVRDLDVLLARTPPADWNEWLRERRREAVRALDRALAGSHPSALIEALSRLPPVDGRRARRALQAAVRRVRRRGRLALSRPEDLQAAHRLRRALRRLRYASEWLGRRPRVLARLQASFGRLNDCDQSLRWFEAWPGGADRPDEGRRLRDERDERHAEALAAWKTAAPRVEGTR